jgi:hypothetical protein
MPKHSMHGSSSPAAPARHLVLVATPRTTQRDDHDLVTCRCRGWNDTCPWCSGSGVVTRGVAESLGMASATETNNLTIGADLRRSLMAVVRGGNEAA